MEDFQPGVNLERTTLEKWVHRHVAAWEARGFLTLAQTLHPEVQFILPAIHRQGRDSVQAALETYLVHYSALRFHLRRLLIDSDKQVAAVEWVGRYIESGEKVCYEILGGTVLDFDQAGLIVRWRTYLDPVRRRTVADLDEPLPGEDWSPCLQPGPLLPPAMIEQAVRAYAQAWSSHDIARLNAAIHDDMVVQPPWDYVVGRAAIETGAQVYFANYTDTHVTPHRLILDPTQPYFGVCEQTFACTNPDTGRRGEDHDFAFFEIAQGKLRYWRTYFDTTHSAQVVEKTIGYLHR